MPDLFVAKTTEKEKDKSSEHPHKVHLKGDEVNQLQKDAQKTISQLPKGKMRFLSAFCTYPEGVRFEHQEADEQVHLFIRKHHITNLRWIATVALLSLVPLLLVVLQSALGLTFLSIPASYGIIILLFYYLLLFGYAFINFITWFYNVGILTQKRIVDIDFSDIMYKNVAVSLLSDIVDVEYTQGGFLHSLYDYGDVMVQTEGIKPNFEFHSVPHPSKIVQTIISLLGTKNE